ncbi:MAG: glycosyltransferase family 4 protein [bacterium]
MNENTLKYRGLGYLLSGFPRLSETFILNEVLELQRLGVALTIFSLKQGANPSPEKELARLKSPVVYVPEVITRCFLKEALWAMGFLFFQRPGKYLQVSARFLLTGKKERFFSTFLSFLRWNWLSVRMQKKHIKRVHAHFAHDPATMAYWISQLLPCPFSFTAHAKDIYCYSKKWLKRKIHQAQFVVTCTQYNQTYCQQVSDNGTPIYPIYHGIDLAKFKRRSFSQAHKLLVLSVGRLIEKKGFADLIAACAQLKSRKRNFTCQIAGDGPLRGFLHRLIDQSGLHDCVQLLGVKTPAELIELYQRADVFVLPCCITEDGDRDGVPNVILEAMAMELPVVSTCISGIPEAVQDGETGLLVQPNQPAEIARAIEDLFSSPTRARQMGQAGRRLIRNHFELHKNVRTLKELLFS